MTTQKGASRRTSISLRLVSTTDLPLLYEFQLDAEANHMAGTRPRTQEAFAALWERNLADPTITARVILTDDEVVGSVCCFQAGDIHYVGYWIDRPYWGRGIASRALQLFLEVLPIRPLQARVATTNVASIRVLQKCGFAIEGYEHSPGSERYIEGEEAILSLR